MTKMAAIRLQSSDGVIFSVDVATVSQMVTIQTMIDHEDEDSDEVTPVPTVNAQVLEKIIQWAKYHKIENQKSEKIAWYIKYFDVELQKIFDIIIAADYLEVKSLLKESCRNVLNNYKWEIIEDVAASGFHDSTIVPLLEKYESKHGLEAIVTIQDNKHLRYFNTKTETWTHLTDIPVESSRGVCKVVCAEGNIYLVGEDYAEERVTEYNPRTNTWRNMPSLKKRSGASVCTLDNKVFVLGDGNYGNTTCEMLDLSHDDPKWRYIDNMKRKHWHGDAVVTEKKIYILGGNYDTSVEVYDVDQDQWKFVTNMPTVRLWPGVAALDNKIYVTGGCDGYDDGDFCGRWSLSSVDCYDPDTNTWSRVASMNIARRGHSLVSLDGRLYAIGGHQVERSVEVYDPGSNTWTLLQLKLDGEVRGAGAGVISVVL